MKFSSKFFSAVSLLAASNSVQAAPTPQDDQNSPRMGDNVQLRIMPLGASITFGIGSSDGNGYRAKLRDLLNDDGNAVTYVGSQSNGTMHNNENEGWSGFRIRPIFDKARESVPGTLPNVILINAGTNECFQRAEGTWLNAKDNTKEMIEWLWENSPNSTVVLSTLLVNNSEDVEVQGCLRFINDEFKDLVVEEQDKSNKIVLADMRGLDGPRPGDMVDETHPGDEGYGKMANVWFKAMTEAADKDMITEPLDPFYGDGKKGGNDDEENENDDDEQEESESDDNSDSNDSSEEPSNEESDVGDLFGEEKTASTDAEQAAATEEDTADSAAASPHGTMSLMGLAVAGTLAFVAA